MESINGIMENDDTDNIDMLGLRVPDMKRVKQARKERANQLKEWHQYDRKMIKESDKLQRKGLTNDRSYYSLTKNVKFPQSLIFLEAAARGDLDEVRELLGGGVCPDVANEDGLTALHQCCIDNNVEMCRLLLRFEANPNSRDTEQWTPLHAAATCHHTELCKILIDHGADLLAMNVDGNMPYECCAPGPTLNLIETEMDKRGITQEEIDDCHRIPQCEMLTDVENLYKAKSDLNQLDSQGASFLHIAAACGFEEVALFLLKRGCIIDMLDKDGWQAIHVAACWGQLEIIELLVNFGADIMAETRNGETVFDICEDLEMHARLVEIKQEIERRHTQQQDMNNRPGKARDLLRRRGSTNPRSASIRRTSMREKKMISRMEAKQEAEMRGVAPTTLEPIEQNPLSPVISEREANHPARPVSSDTENVNRKPKINPTDAPHNSNSGPITTTNVQSKTSSPTNNSSYRSNRPPAIDEKHRNSMKGQIRSREKELNNQANRSNHLPPTEQTDSGVATLTNQSPQRQSVKEKGSKQTVNGILSQDNETTGYSTYPEGTHNNATLPTASVHSPTSRRPKIRVDYNTNSLPPAPLKSRTSYPDNSGTYRESNPNTQSARIMRPPNRSSIDPRIKQDQRDTNLSMHNAYYEPQMLTGQRMYTDDNHNVIPVYNTNPRQIVHRNTNQPGQRQQQTARHTAPRRELINYIDEVGKKPSGKCCTVM